MRFCENAKINSLLDRFFSLCPLLGRFFSSALSVYIGYTNTLIRWSQKVAQFCEPFCGSWKSNVWQKRHFLFFLVNSLVNMYCFWDVFSKMQVFKTINFASNRWVVVQGFWSKIIDFCKSRSICLPPNSHVTKQEMTTTVCGSNLVVSKVYAPAWIAQYESSRCIHFCITQTATTPSRPRYP